MRNAHGPPNSCGMTVPVLLPDTLSLIGNTPLVRLKGPSDAAGCDIFGKCEFANPGASVKDRAALWIVRDAEEKGLLQPGGTIVEGTAGNTGIGLALVANALGYKTVIVMPETQSREKMDTLRALRAAGARVAAEHALGQVVAAARRRLAAVLVRCARLPHDAGAGDSSVAHVVVVQRPLRGRVGVLDRDDDREGLACSLS